jgi:hypothetical protein
MPSSSNTAEIIVNLQGEDSLRDTVLVGIDVKQHDWDAIVSLMFMPRIKSRYSELQLVFYDIEVFSFYFDKGHIFHNVEDMKLLSLPSGSVYLTLDPEPGSMVVADPSLLFPHSDDNFVVSAKRVDANWKLK